MNSSVKRLIELDISPETSQTLEDIIISNNQLPIFLEMLSNKDEGHKLAPFDNEKDIILFLKMYDAVNESLYYCGHWCGPTSTTFSKSLLNLVNAKPPGHAYD